MKRSFTILTFAIFASAHAGKPTRTTASSDTDYGSDEVRVTCSMPCRMAVYGAEVELRYHSGFSAFGVTEALSEACKEDEKKIKAKHCGKMPESEGTIRYLYEAECLHGAIKTSCRL